MWPDLKRNTFVVVLLKTGGGMVNPVQQSTATKQVGLKIAGLEILKSQRLGCAC